MSLSTGLCLCSLKGLSSAAGVWGCDRVDMANVLEFARGNCRGKKLFGESEKTDFGVARTEVTDG